MYDAGCAMFVPDPITFRPQLIKLVLRENR